MVVETEVVAVEELKGDPVTMCFEGNTNKTSEELSAQKELRSEESFLGFLSGLLGGWAVVHFATRERAMGKEIVGRGRDKALSVGHAKFEMPINF